MQTVTTQKRGSPAAINTQLRNQAKNEPSEKVPPQRELLILWTLRGTGTEGVYGLDIQRAIEQCSGGAESISHGSLYSLLKRLRSREYIDSYEGDAIGGGAKRHYYFLTEKGNSLVSFVDDLFSSLKTWKPE